MADQIENIELEEGELEDPELEEESHDIVVVQPVAESSFSSMLAQARVLVRSGILPPVIRNPEQAVAIMIRGRELGIGPMEALSSINIIKGKVSSSTQLMLALVYRSGFLEDIEMIRGDPAKVTMTRKNMSPHTVTFGSKEAKMMGLLGKDTYRRFPKVMFLWRAIAMCARVVFPDVIGGVYTPDELGVSINSDRAILAQPDSIDWVEADSITEPAPTTWQELLTRTGKTLKDLGSVAEAEKMTVEEIGEKFEEWTG